MIQTDEATEKEAPPIERLPVVTTPFELIQHALARGIDTQQLERLMDLQERWEQSRAKEAFASAMNRAQAEMPAVVKDRNNPHTGSRYATYESVNETLKPIYTKHGFSLSFGEAEGAKEGSIRLVCNVRHVGGHCEPYYGTFQLDDSGAKGTVNKTGIQATGSTYSYGRRYLTKLIFNVAETDEDQDGNAPSELIEPHEIAFIEERLRLANSNLVKFLKWIKAPGLDKITKDQLAKAVVACKWPAVPEKASGS